MVAGEIPNLYLFACDVSVYEVSLYVATEESKAVYTVLLAQIELHFGFQVPLLAPLLHVVTVASPPTQCMGQKDNAS